MNDKGMKKILIVEDELITALAEETMLRENGYDVIITSDGESAVRFALDDPTIDLILMDIDLGNGIDGPTAADIIIKKRDLPIVFLTSHSEREIVEKVKSITRYGFVIKYSGDFVLLSSLEMAFELFYAHIKTKESEADFRQLAASKNEAFVLSDALIEDLIYISPACWDIWKLDSSQVKKDSWISTYLKTIHPDDLPEILNARRILLEKEEAYTGEYRIICGDGEIKWIRGSAYRVYNDSGILVKFAGVAEDITKRKYAEEALIKSEAKFRSYIENAPIAIIIVDNKGKYIETNPLTAKGLGYSEDQLLNMHIHDTVDPSHYEVAENHFKTVLKEGKAISDILFRRKDDSVLWAQVNAVRLSEERIMAFCQDITSRIKSEVFLFKKLKN